MNLEDPDYQLSAAMGKVGHAHLHDSMYGYWCGRAAT